MAVAGCAPSMSSLQRPVDSELARRLAPDASVRSSDDPKVAAAIAERLARPLDVDGAVRIALANNARMQAALDALGVAGGGLAWSLGATEVEVESRHGGGGHETELAVIQDILGVLTSARRRAAARFDVEATRAIATATALRLAARVEIAFHDLLAAQQELELRHTAFDAADAAALVRERMHAAGNASDLAQARDRDAREQARIEAARAEAAVEAAREALNALLGLTGEQTKWSATGHLPDAPADAPALDTLEATAVAASLDLAAGRARADAAANHAADERLRAFLPRLGLGVSATDHDHVIQVGPAIRIGVPLFDWNSANRARANAEQRRTEHELTAVAVELRAGARAARIAALAAYGEARHLRDVVLPLRQQIVDETLKHYNAMDADPFALILARRELADAGHQYLDALRRYANAQSAVIALERGVLVDATGTELHR
jgi:cobalt-zinc-cadmium efflux system outer membrane protein